MLRAFPRPKSLISWLLCMPCRQVTQDAYLGLGLRCPGLGLPAKLIVGWALLSGYVLPTITNYCHPLSSALPPTWRNISRAKSSHGILSQDTAGPLLSATSAVPSCTPIASWPFALPLPSCLIVEASAFDWLLLFRYTEH